MAYVSERETVQVLQDVIRAPTVNPPADTRQCIEVLRRVCRDAGIDSEVVARHPERANLVVRWRGSRPGPTLVLNGHVDVVPPGEGWSVDPFGGELRDGMVWGRGSCDMKSGVVALLMAMVAWKRSGREFAGELLLQAVADEETGSRDGTLYLLEQGIGSDANFAICAEPTSLRVERGNRGLRWIDITVMGQASHAGRPQLGVNAVSIAAQMIAALDAEPLDLRNDAFEIPTASRSVTMVSGGQTVNVIPDRCSFAVDRRMLPGESENDVLAEIESTIAPIAARHPGAEYRIDVRDGGWDPYLLDEDEPILVAAVEAAREALGREPELGGKAACTDASHLVTRVAVPTVLFGPGNERLSHKPDERVAAADLIAGVDVYLRLFERLMA